VLLITTKTKKMATHKSHLAMSALRLDANGNSEVKTLKFETGAKMSCGTGSANRNNPYEFSLEIEKWNVFAKIEEKHRCKKCNEIYKRKLEEHKLEKSRLVKS
jgi:hypothetical protein